MRLKSVSFSEIGNNWPSQNIQPAGAKLPANMRISPTYGCAISFSFSSARGRFLAAQYKSSRLGRAAYSNGPGCRRRLRLIRQSSIPDSRVSDRRCYHHPENYRLELQFHWLLLTTH